MQRNVFGIAESEIHSRAEKMLRKQADYLKSINEHKDAVIKAYSEMCANKYLTSYTNHDIVEALDALRNRIAYHDDSKYGDEEFEAYRKNFYPIDAQEKDLNKEDFDRAWEHHYTVNSHHPEHFVIAGNPTDMPLIDILEMICDWNSFAILGKGEGTKKWWTTNEEGLEKRKIMTPNTVNQVERILKMIDE